MAKERGVLTAEQAGDELQVDRKTIYRYIRQGKLVASRLGRTYRISKRSIALRLWATRTREDVTLLRMPVGHVPRVRLWRREVDL